MPHGRLKIVSGADTNQTPALNQGGIAQSQLIRYMPDGADGILVQKLGGWAKFYGNQIQSTVRALWPWNDQNDVSHLAFGADKQLGIITNGSLNDITPNTLSYSVPVHMVTTAGSAVVTVTDGGNFTGTTTSASGTGTISTLTYTGTSFIYPVGATILIAGVTPTGFNGNYIVTASSSGSVSYKNTTVGPQSVAGTIQNQGSTTQQGSVYIETQVSVGGLTIFGIYNTTRLTATTYTINAVDIFGNPQPAPYSTTSQATTGASGTGTVATLTFTGPYTFPIGTQIVVSGVTPSTYNGTFIVTASTTGSVSYTSTSTGAQSGAGTITDFGSLAQFSMTQGSPTVTVTFYNHQLLAGNTYSMNVPTVVNGLVLSGAYDVISVLNSYQFTINLGINASAAATTAASGTGSVATLTFSNSSGVYAFPVGSTITVSGMSPAGYNGVYTVTASTSNTVSYANTTTGAQSGSGTIWRSDAFIPQNNGNVAFEYFIGNITTQVGSGFGAGGFGGGGFGVGITPSSAAGIPISTFDWYLDNWGSILVAVPNISGVQDYGSPIYVYDPTQNSPSASIITQGPIKANGVFVAMPQRQLVAWGVTFTGIQDHLLIAWCDVSNFTIWADQPQNQAGSYRIPRGSSIIGAMQGPQQGLIWTDIALWAMQYIGQPDIYGFNEISTGCGLIAPKAMGILNGVVYWMSQSQFFVMNASGVQVLPCAIWDTIFQQIDASNVNHIRCAPNSRFGEISWFIPLIGGNGENGFCVKYNTVTNQWDYSTAPLTRSAWTNQSILGAPIGAGTDGYIYQHEYMNGQTLLNADTQPMSSSFTTGLFAMSEGDVLTYIDQFWPDMKWGLYGNTPNANVEFTFYVYGYPGDAPVVYGPYTVTQAIQYFCPRFRGRLVAMQVGSTDIDSFWRTGANRFRYQPDGKF